jgi:hypothetical protein|tara:strand:- start:6363 stop:6641 length:279 start_codon:yes stop_codon:yes gene_type:complete
MNNKIIKELIKRKVIKNGTTINATVRANGIGGQVVIVPKDIDVTVVDENGIVAWERDYAGRDHKYNVKLTDINDVEGMEITRLAKAYKIKIT